MKSILKVLPMIFLLFVAQSFAETQGEKLANAVVLGRLSEVDSILSQQADLITYKDANGNSLMHLAINFYNDGMVDLLIKHKASVKILNRNNESPIQRAAFFGLNKALLSLLKAGADWNSLSVEMKNEYSRYPDIKEWIALNTKPSTEPESKSGKTVLELPGAQLQVINFSVKNGH
jgi:ankyrin repeat protein